MKNMRFVSYETAHHLLPGTPATVAIVQHDLALHNGAKKLQSHVIGSRTETMPSWRTVR